MTGYLGNKHLNDLNNSVHRNKDARFELETWGLHFGGQVSLTGRVVPSEKILLQDNIVSAVVFL